MTDFYSQLADDYDSMTRFDRRLTGMRSALGNLVDRFAIGSALDVACGTGIGVIALAQLGVDATGTDLNPEMILRAHAHANDLGIDRIRLEVAGMGDTFPGMKTDYDAIFCIGNSIPHLLDDGALNSVCRHFCNILKPGGRLFIQLKNFEMLLTTGDRFVGAHREGAKEFIRFYDFTQNRLDFNILRITWDADKAASHDLITTSLRPYTRTDFDDALAGFSSVSYHATLGLDTFEPDASSDLLAVAVR